MFFHAEQTIIKGYKKVPSPPSSVLSRLPRFLYSSHLQFPKSFFKIIFPTSTYIIVDREHLKELVTASETHLSFIKTSNDSIESPYTFSETFAQNHYHITVVRRHLTRRLPDLMSDIVDEADSTLNELIPLSEGTPLKPCSFVLGE